MQLGIKVVLAASHMSDSHWACIQLSLSSLLLSWCCWATFLPHCTRVVVLPNSSVGLYIYKLLNVILLNLAQISRSLRSFMLLTPVTNIFNAFFQSPPYLKAWWAGCLGQVPVINIFVPLIQVHFHCLLCKNGARPCKYLSFTSLYNVKICQQKALERPFRKSMSSWYQYVPLSMLLQHMTSMESISYRAWWSVAHGTFPRADVSLNSFTEQCCWCNSFQWMGSLESTAL